MKRLHRAWAICLGCTLMLFVCGGLSVNAFSVTQPYVLAYGGFTNTQTSLIPTIRSAAYLRGTLAVGRYYRRIGYRAGCALSAVVAASAALPGDRLENVAAACGLMKQAGEIAARQGGPGSFIPAFLDALYQEVQG